MSTRVQVILDNEHKVLIEHQARREGLSLSAWIRRAALAQLEAQRRARRVDDLESFFAEINSRPDEALEPDWEVVKAQLAEDKAAGDTGT